MQNQNSENNSEKTKKWDTKNKTYLKNIPVKKE